MSAQPAEPIATAKIPFASARAHAMTVEGILSDAEMIRKPHSSLRTRRRGRAAQDFDAFYEQRAAARDPKDDLLVISTDGKGVVMRHEDLREGRRKAAEKSVRKLDPLPPRKTRLRRVK
jgi:hypothetical protein